MKKMIVGFLAALAAGTLFAQMPQTVHTNAVQNRKLSPEMQQRADDVKAYMAALPTQYEPGDFQKEISKSFLPDNRIRGGAFGTNLPHQPHGMSFEEMDTNHTGEITFDKFKAAHIRAVKERFARMDANGDGKISPDEWAAAQKHQAGHHHGQADAPDKAMPEFATLDRNSDGFISETEFWIGSTMAGLQKFEDTK
jgi:Ca2+-binding EF-hand superfamily protein